MPMRDPFTAAIPVSLCPICGHSVDSASSLANPGAAPDPGDWVVCISCAAVLEFDAGLRLAIPAAAEVEEALKSGSDLRRTIAAVRMANRATRPAREPGKPS